MPTELTPATAARLGALADQLDAEALGRLPFGSGELAEAMAQSNAVRRLAGQPGGTAGQEGGPVAEAATPLGDARIARLQCEFPDGSQVHDVHSVGCRIDDGCLKSPRGCPCWCHRQAAAGAARGIGRRAPTPNLTEYEAASGIYRAERCLAHFEPEPCVVCASLVAGEL